MNHYPHFTFYADDAAGSPNEELWKTSTPPKCIHVQCKPESLSRLSSLPENGLAIVGTRNPQARTVSWVEQFVKRLAGTELMILSGFARGIDSVAHRAALQAGLTTVAVLGAGLDQNYPKENMNLREEILSSGGILITEYPLGTEPRGFQFLARNRLIAGWSKATFVAEAGARSGALNTAKWAREQNRITFALPCFPGDHFLTGNQTLLDRDHALAIWGIHSLGAAWLPLATHEFRQLTLPSNSPQKRDIPKEDPSILMLIAEVERLTYQKGGVSTSDLLNWAFATGWSPSDFFLTLEKAITQEAIQEQLGVLVRIPFSGAPVHVS
jgi:DNA protecting protein DprA